MQKLIIFLLFAFSVLVSSAQKQELEQLALNIEKLAQFRKILRNMKQGYEILNTGYTTIKDLSKGNFNLHKTFLDKLLDVSPAVKNYKKVALIIAYQKNIIAEYKTAFTRFKKNQLFSNNELDYMGRTYERLVAESLQNLDDLIMVLAAGKLRMSDEERLKSIDRIFDKMQEKLVFLRRFNNQTSVLALQRMKEKNDIDAMRAIHGTRQ